MVKDTDEIMEESIEEVVSVDALNDISESEDVEVKDKKKEKKVKKLSQKDYEKKVLEFSDSGLTSEKIGQKLRDEGIHPNDYEGKISRILGDKYVNPDLKNVENKLKRIEKHSDNNKQDKRAKREKDRVFSQIRKLKQYFGIEIVKKRNEKKVRK